MTFVTGGTGVLGAHLLLHLLQQGKKITAICRPNSNKHKVKHVFAYYTDNADSLFHSINWIEADLLDYNSIVTAMHNAKEVYHAAAMVSFEKQMAKEMKYLNRQGTANVVNAALELQVQSFCHISSIAALGDSKLGEPVDESSERSTASYHSAYAESKYSAEMEVWRGNAEGLNTVIVNPSIILAPGDWGRSSTNFFPTVWKGFKFSTPGSSGFVDVRDVTHISFKLMEDKCFGERYIINADSVKYHDLFSCIAQQLNKPKPNIPVPKWIMVLAEKIIRLKTNLLGGNALITKDTITSAFSDSYYSNKKISDLLHYSFIPYQESVTHIAKLFLSDINKQNR